MPERQFFRVQQQAICGRKCFAFGVEFIAEDHVAECLHVYPQLVRTACQRKKPQPGCVFASIHNLPACLRGFAVIAVDTMARLVVGINRQRQIDQPFVTFDTPQTTAT